MKNPFKPKRIGTGYLLRWHLIPRNRWFNIYLHKFVGDDDERACHDHPWWSLSIRLKGRMIENYIEHVPFQISDGGISLNHERLAPRFCFRHAGFAHRLELINKPCWTLFITGPRKREWGFHCKKGWQHWSTMTTASGETIGGCE